MYGSTIRVWWKCKENPTHEWEAQVVKRKYDRGCPFCRGNKASNDNNLEKANPKLAEEWHPTKNGSLIPSQVRPFSHKKVWWKCLNNPNHDWQATISSRMKGSRCIVCYNQTSLPEQMLFFYLKQAFPDTLNRAKLNGFEVDIYIPSLKIAIEYDGHYHKNKLKNDLKKDKAIFEAGIDLIRIRYKTLPILKNSTSKIIYESDANEKCYEKNVRETFELIKQLRNVSSIIKVDITKDKEIIYQNLKKVQIENSLQQNRPDIAIQWHPIKNGELNPIDIDIKSGLTVWWKCPNGDDHEWETRVIKRTLRGDGCPFCSGHRVSKTNCLSATHQELLQYWDYEKNNRISIFPESIQAGSGKTIYWKCKNEHSFQRSPYAMKQAVHKCPECYKSKL